MKFRILISLILISFFGVNHLFVGQAFAVQLPRYLGTEKKFRGYVYNPNDVYRYVGHYGYQGFIEFGEGEEVSTVTMGDSSLWLFEHLGNRLFLKPVAKDASTNMTVITGDRIYHFELTAKIASSIDDPDLIFVAKFIYPDEKDKNILQFTKKAKSDSPDLRNLAAFNFNYEFTGEPNIAPVKVFDDGSFTYMQFSDANPEIPAIFSVDSAGFEELINFRVSNDYVIIETIASQFTLRSGPDIVCVYNNNRLKTGLASKSSNSARNSPAVNITPSSGADVGGGGAFPDVGSILGGKR